MHVKTPTVFQIEATECGAASLSMIFQYYGLHLPLEQMRIETGVSRDGCNAWNILQAARKYGLDCKAKRAEPEELLKMRPPCIIHWNMEHFLVYEGHQGSKIYLNDPAKGRVEVSREELDDSFTGIVLSFTRTAAFQTSAKQSGILDFFRSRLQGQISSLIPLFILGLWLVFPALIFPALSQYFIDEVLMAGRETYFNGLMLFMAVCLLIQALMSYQRSQLLQRLQSKLTLFSGSEFLLRLFRLPMSFFDQRYTGDVARRVDDNSSVSSFIAGDLAGICLNLLEAAFYLLMLLLMSPLLTLIGLLSILGNLLMVRFFWQKLAGLTTKLQQDTGKLYGALSAGLRITSTLKASGAEDVYISRILGFEARKLALSEEMGKKQEILDSIPQAVSKISQVLMLIVAAGLVMQGHFSVGRFVAFNTLYASFAAPLDDLVKESRSLQSLRSNILRVEDIEKYPPDWKFQERTVRPLERKLQGEVWFEQVSFGYAILEDPLISNFSFRLSPGQTVALVGPSGSGKSTVGKIASGLYQPWSGQVYLDRIPYAEVPETVLDTSIATVSQSIALFAGSIRDNLTLWNDGILEEDMIQAARDACIHDDIVARSGGYDAQLDEDGSNFSGGQRQRLEIARALCLNPSILILDEATSALDPITEKHIIDHIKRRGISCIVVAHRLSAIRDADLILVLDRGKIVQYGNHESLMAQEGLYRRLLQKM